MKGDRALLVWGGALLTVLVILAAGAGLWTDWDPLEQPDPVAGRFLPPGAQMTLVHLRDGNTLLADRAVPLSDGLEIERLGATRILAAAELGESPQGEVFEVRRFLLGTDRFGRDLWTRLLYGARLSLSIGVASGVLALFLGLLIGGIAASSGGWTDAIAMRLADTLLAFPTLFLVITLAALFDAGAVWIVVVLALTGWMGTARLVRAEILSLKKRDFVLAADAVGQTRLGVLIRHLLPNALTPVIAYTALRVGDIILVEASLSFLGLGVAPPSPTWGNMIALGTDSLTRAWWVATFPGIAIGLTVISFHLLGDGLRAWLDPRAG